MNKRIISCFLILTLILGICPVTETKADTKKNCLLMEGTVYTDGYGKQWITDSSLLPQNVGTSYGDASFQEEFDVGDISLEEVPVLVGEEDGIHYVVEQIKAHNSKILFSLEAYMDVTDIETLRTVSRSIMCSAYRLLETYNGIPNEGNYFYGTLGIGSFKAFKIDGQVVFAVLQNYRTTLEQEAQVALAIEQLKQEIGVSKFYRDEVQYIEPLYQWIYENVVYDTDSYNRHISGEQIPFDTSYTAYAAVIEKKAVCLGIASLVYRYLISCGVECRIVRNGTHAWNAVKVRGKWYETDMTWDLNGQERNPRYYLLSHKNMSKTHPWSEETCENEDLTALPWGTVNYMSVLNLYANDVKDIFTFTKKNLLGIQDMEVTDQDGNVLKKDVDYTIRYSYGMRDTMNYTITSLDDSNISTRGSYQLKLKTPKIVKIERIRRKAVYKTIIRYEYSYKVTFDKAPKEIGADRYYVRFQFRDVPTKGYSNLMADYRYTTTKYCYSGWFGGNWYDSKQANHGPNDMDCYISAFSERKVELGTKGEINYSIKKFQSDTALSVSKKGKNLIKKPKQKKEEYPFLSLMTSKFDAMHSGEKAPSFKKSYKDTQYTFSKKKFSK